jgi:hypothetical protein
LIEKFTKLINISRVEKKNEFKKLFKMSEKFSLEIKKKFEKNFILFFSSSNSSSKFL